VEAEVKPYGIGQKVKDLNGDGGEKSREPSPLPLITWPGQKAGAPPPDGKDQARKSPSRSPSKTQHPKAKAKGKGKKGKDKGKGKGGKGLKGGKKGKGRGKFQGTFRKVTIPGKDAKGAGSEQAK
jgi:hypothetical protein